MTEHITKTGIFYHNNVLDIYNQWPSPIAIISDGPYGIDGYEGDAHKPHNLSEMYLPHIKAWSKAATSQTTLWFWCTEVGWATVHPLLEQHGWQYRGCNIWDKGIEHIAGNCNGKTMRKFPTVTEVCVHYVRKEEFLLQPGQTISLQQWMRNEWKRTGLPMNDANKACGVKNAASRKYLAKDHLWYFPPKDEFMKMINYANKYGKKENAPYFSIDGQKSLSENQWQRLRAKFNFEYGITNVWSYPALRNKERLKNGNILSHPNQKPLELMKRIIAASTDENDIIWEPFGGTATACKAAQIMNRKYFGCEIKEKYFLLSKQRLEEI